MAVRNQSWPVAGLGKKSIEAENASQIKYRNFTGTLTSPTKLECTDREILLSEFPAD